MKNMYKMMLLAVGLLMGTASLNAQNRYIFGDGETRSTAIVTSDNMEIMQKDDNIGYFSFGKERTCPNRANATMHTLTINVNDGETQEIHVASGENYHNFNQWESSFSDNVEEGYYDIMVVGYYNNGMRVITYDSVLVFEDVVIEASFNECIYTFSIDAVDEDGHSLSGNAYASCDYMATYIWLNGTRAFAYMPIGYPNLSEFSNLHFNSFDERSSLSLTVNLHTTTQEVYNITFPTVYGSSDNVVFQNNAEDLIAHQEKYYLNNYDTAYYHMNFLNMYDETMWIGMFVWERELTFDPNLPLSVISNNKINAPSVYTGTPQTLLYPAIYESYSFSWPKYDNFLSPFGMYYNEENQLVSEPFGRRYDVIVAYTMPDYLEVFPQTPALTVNDPATMLTFGERTPISYYQAYALKASQTFTGQYTFQPSFVFSIGEHGCQRIGDKSAIATITYDGEEIFSDSLYKWMSWQEYQNANAGVVIMDINNTHLSVDDVEKYNQTHIEFDFNREDVTAPTMTILQVKDENGKENIELPNISSSYINFAAGDFSPHYTEEGGYGHFDYMQYDSKPEIEVNYAITDPVMGNNWYSLEYTENKDMFHETYGNYFTINLSQLPAEAADKWISLEFVLTDDAGNLMKQELSNVFYVGRLESVNEQTTLPHVVYPNPFTSKVKITAAQAVEGEANIAVYNILGEQVYSKTQNCAETKEFIIDGSTWKPGVYFYSISTKDGLLQGKIVKE